jgi:hypothetical protein
MITNKRKLLLGSYDTAEQLWTLTAWNFSDPVQERTWVHVPGRRKGPIDASTALTDGDPVYGSRTLTATLECSEGTYLEREARIEQMVNWLDGWWTDIILPDDIGRRRYIRGTVSVKKVYNNLAHAQVQVTATCEPWKYAAAETSVVLTAGTTEKMAELTNSGRLTVVPLLTIANAADGTAASVLLKYGVYSWTLGAGTYALPDMVLKPGSASLSYSGKGSLTFTYREAVL